VPGLIPSTPTQLLITLVLVLPGFVYQETRIRLRGRAPGEQELTGRLLRAIGLSLLFGLLYVAALGPAWLQNVGRAEWAVEHARALAIWVLVLGLVVPVGVALVPNLLDSWSIRDLLARFRLSRWTRYDATPSAWDRAFRDAGPCFVRVRMKDGTWFAGYYGMASYASSFPDPQSLFLESSFAVSLDGEIGDPIEGTVGAIVNCSDATLVELLRAADEPVLEGASTKEKQQ